MERALLVEVTTYGFLHAGMAPLRREVLKRTWPYLPGGTLYGALRAGLIRLDGPDGPGPSTLLAELAGGRLRFTPLLPDMTGRITDAQRYSEQMQLLADVESGVEAARPARYQTTPHAPLSRRFEQVEGSLLYAVESHAPEQRYRGWIFTSAAGERALRRGLGLLPFLPLGGKGKYTAAEIQVVEVTERRELAAALAARLGGGEFTVELASPAAIEGADLGILKDALRMSVRPPRVYRVWRTGLYPDQTDRENGGLHRYGVEAPGGTDVPLAWQAGDGYLYGQVTQPVRALPEGCRFTFDGAQAGTVAEAFVAGVGRADWAGLGWGQLFVRAARAQEVTHG